MNENIIKKEKTDTITNILIFSKRIKYLIDDLYLKTQKQDFYILQEWLKELIYNIETEIQNYIMLDKSY